MIKIEWKNKTGKYAEGSDCFVGPYKVASTVRDVGSRDGPKDAKLWRGAIYLPGIAIREDLNHFVSDSDAQQIVDVVVRKWFERIEQIKTPARSDD